MGLKRKDVIQKCLLCGEGLLHNQWNPMFFRVTLERHVVDMQAVHRQAGMEQFIGGANPSPHAVAIANVMGLDEDMSKPLGAIPIFLVCGDCAGVGDDDPDRITASLETMANKAQERERPDDDEADTG
jgi:hypothetical protein